MRLEHLWQLVIWHSPSSAAKSAKRINTNPGLTGKRVVMHETADTHDERDILCSSWGPVSAWCSLDVHW
jgi:hypothetical protein